MIKRVVFAAVSLSILGATPVAAYQDCYENCYLNCIYKGGLPWVCSAECMEMVCRGSGGALTEAGAL